ncbi:MAG: alpha-ketoglutarate-dependent dioxygenase AlkB [Deltaproteobacteria bacterium]|nr:MAG: alpha-ketoglutarate-dependent dioxygenase AlkB [Deltaproteobacteria bacterium]
MLRTIELDPGTWLQHDSAWLEPEEADRLLSDLVAEVRWEERPIYAFGKAIMQPRLIGWAGDLPYRYSGQTLPPRAWTPALRRLHAAVEEATGQRFNHAMLNRYRDGNDHVSMHADNEPELGQDPIIASVSLGATRRFVIQFKRKRGRKRSYRLRHGSLLVMGGSFQHRWRHAVPRDPACEAERVNITFRLLHGPPGWRAPAEHRSMPEGEAQP